MVDLASVQALPEVGDWPATIPRLETGWRQTGGAVDPANDQGITNWQAGELTKRTRVLKDRVDALTTKAAPLVTVGPGGQYATINAALAALSDRRPSYVPGGFMAEVRLLAGYVMAEQVLVNGINLGWITITSVAAEVQIDRSVLINELADGHYPAWGARNAGVIPAIGCLFAMTETGVAPGRHGISLLAGAGGRVLAGAGVRNAGDCGANVYKAATLDAAGAIFSQAKQVGLLVSNGSTASFQNGIAVDCGYRAIAASTGSRINAVEADLRRGGTNCVYANAGCQIAMTGAQARVGAADATTDIICQQGSTIAAAGSTGGTSVTINQLSAAGVVFK